MKEARINKNNRARHWKIAVILAVVIVANLTVGLSVSSVGVASELGAGGYPLYTTANISAVPQPIIDDAIRNAEELFGRIKDESLDYINELLAMYTESMNKDVLLIFNPGGWGSSPAEVENGWGSILDGIKQQLAASGMDSLVLTFQRTTDNWLGRCKELEEIFTGYSSKAKDLASRVEFLTAHNPELKIIITGESMGTIMSGKVMDVLGTNPQVFSIQTGPPPWYKMENTERTLVITDNGIMPDSFSRGDLFTMLKANLAALFNLRSAENNQGTVLKLFRSPGHDYSWEYPAVSLQITEFLENTVGGK